MNKTKAYLGCLGNFLLATLGVVGVGWLLIAKYPKIINTVYTVGGILIIMFLWNAIDDMNKRMRQAQKKANEPINNAVIDVQAVDVEPKIEEEKKDNPE